MPDQSILLSETATRAKLHKELCVFFIFLGGLLAILAGFAFAGISGNPAPLGGIPWHLALAIPLTVLAALHLLAGGLLATTHRRAFSVLGALASTLLSVCFFLFMFFGTGTVPINPVSIVVAAIPIIVWNRVGKFLSATRNASTGQVPRTL